MSPATGAATAGHAERMDLALQAAASCRLAAPPNPWVGCVVASPSGQLFSGATRPAGGPHAEIQALSAAGDHARGADLYVTLEPCAHTGRTGPCTDIIIAAGVARVYVAVTDPDPRVNGNGLDRLRQAGVEVHVGLRAAEAAQQLAPYLKQRRTGLPWVVLKLAATLDGRIAAPDGDSQWITGPQARADAHRLRAHSDAILVGAGTVRADDPALTVRLWQPPTGVQPRASEPLRVVLGTAPPQARLHPALELCGEPRAVLADLAQRGVLQVLVEGGASVAAAFHRAGVVDRYSIYLAPALFGGGDARPMFVGSGAVGMDDLWRGEVLDVVRLGADLRIDLGPAGSAR